MGGFDSRRGRTDESASIRVSSARNTQSISSNSPASSSVGFASVREGRERRKEEEGKEGE